MVATEKQEKLFRAFGFQSFLAGTIGYSLYYVCRTSLNVVKKPILDSGMLDASQLGLIGSVLLFAYAIGKFVNGFLAAHCNIKRFMVGQHHSDGSFRYFNRSSHMLSRWSYGCFQDCSINNFVCIANPELEIQKE